MRISIRLLALIVPSLLAGCIAPPGYYGPTAGYAPAYGQQWQGPAVAAYGEPDWNGGTVVVYGESRYPVIVDPNYGRGFWDSGRRWHGAPQQYQWSRQEPPRREAPQQGRALFQGQPPIVQQRQQIVQGQPPGRPPAPPQDRPQQPPQGVQQRHEATGNRCDHRQPGC